jgi:hypothetical protein
MGRYVRTVTEQRLGLEGIFEVTQILAKERFSTSHDVALWKGSALASGIDSRHVIEPRRRVYLTHAPEHPNQLIESLKLMSSQEYKGKVFIVPMLRR